MAAKYIMGYISKVSGGGKKVQVSVKNNGLAFSSLPSSNSVLLFFTFRFHFIVQEEQNLILFISEVTYVQQDLQVPAISLMCWICYSQNS